VGDIIVFPKPSDDEVKDGHPSHYTDLPTSLDLQSAAASKFIQQFWAQAKEKAADILAPDFHEIILCGCGDSHHAAYTLAYAIANWTDRPVQGLHAMEAARYTIPRSTGEGLLVVGISASGETARTIEAIRLAKDLGARTLGITADRHSTLATTVDDTFALDLPGPTEGPGLISYLAGLMAGYAIGIQLSKPRLKEEVDEAVQSLSEALSEWAEGESELGRAAAQQVDPTRPILFLGSGPIRGAAMFAAAKVIEAAGQSASAQELEEWAHLEYFNEPSRLPIWLLSAGGRASQREHEIEQAARRIGRYVIRSQWRHGSDWLREDLSPLALWAGPVAYANSLMGRIGERPFRGFGGGRSPEEGGGASRTQSSEQLHSIEDLYRFDPLN